MWSYQVNSMMREIEREREKGREIGLIGGGIFRNDSVTFRSIIIGGNDVINAVPFGNNKRSGYRESDSVFDECQINEPIQASTA